MRPQIQILRKTTMIDEKINIVLSGCLPHQEVELHAQTLDDFGRIWSSHAVFMTDQEGQIDLSLSSPIQGSYTSSDSMGMFWSMTLQQPKQGPPYFIKGSTKPQSFTFQLKANHQIVAEQTFLVEFVSEDVEVSIIENPFVGKYFRPRHKENLPTLLVMGGSPGGLYWSEQVASLLASKGYATLALAYLDYEGKHGLPSQFTEIPLNYFMQAADWIKKQPETQDKIGLVGISKGGELSLLLASRFLSNVKAIVSFVPSSHVFAGFSMGRGLHQSSWSYNEKPVTFIPYPETDIDFTNWKNPLSLRELHEQAFLQATEQQIKQARIPIEKANCPILLISTQTDATWPSYEMCQTMTQILEEHSYPFEVKHLSFAHASHVFSIPYLPPYIDHPALTKEHAAKAIETAWQATLSFLNQHLLHG
ncbi:acyl-CoA thioesterase/bile acid-CoA:amino acid N-acyltransferase family protein [Thermoflavimicrobium dichotomicum]|uniref:Acyl-CoA thioester hydrolase/BAAT N-terminal region n=1 Tax=Thermoflavimicrobium dichotomicum TaxID=46223 RepID=A0A1I3SWJ6_9BACL|nr:alpha/beta fold hydrolase [Thermoflavimicrobium dichotomicum]SFJ63208.1 Acyl-CoA thioester hydrolase/BAAT N-terminal region [Thermoflavimicrobium dichotomicum]